jgi:two-component system, cell cycle sensor histidine kinase and response regulator CckA
MCHFSTDYASFSTDRCKAPGKLSPDVLYELFHRLPDGVIAISANGRICHVNQAAAEMFGVTIDNLVGRKVWDMIVLPNSGLGNAEDEKTVDFSHQVELILRREDNTELVLGVTKISEMTVTFSMNLLLLRDLSSERVARENRLHAQKLEAIGRLAGGVAHDFNNLLTVISGYSEILIEDKMEWEDSTKYLGEILKSSKRASEMTKQLLAFSRRQPLVPTCISPVALIGSMAEMLVRIIPEHIEIKLATGHDVGHVVADVGQLENAILNLVANARDAMPHGGKIVIEATDTWLDEEYVRKRHGVQVGAYVMIAISDTGSGMTEEVRSKVFQPFFTTKEIGKGTGLGLASVYGFVKQSGGHIFVYSEIGCGSTFKIYLPKVSSAGLSEPQRRDRAILPGGSETILLVEDDQAVRTVLSTALVARGYEILPAESVDEAVVIAESAMSRIQLIISDLVMPGGGGMELVKLLQPRLPHVPVLFLSGYTDDAALALGVLDKPGDFLQKPVSPSHLANTVRMMINRSRACQ